MVKYWFRCGNACDGVRASEVMSEHSVQTVYHAAAYKHVPILEDNVVEGFRNNALGTRTVALAAIENHVERFILISTDKAVRPPNVMGATKRVAELFVQDLASRNHQIQIGIVRFGNVLGSSGSVIPLFQKQIQSGGPLTVTHKEITLLHDHSRGRFSCDSGRYHGARGEVFVLDMGKPVKIIDLAPMIHLAGLSVKDGKNPNGDIVIEFTGLRPGEKLYEELLIGDDVEATKHPMIMRANETSASTEKLSELIEKIESPTEILESNEIKQILSDLVDGYSEHL